MITDPSDHTLPDEAERFVGLFDVLGFKNLVKTNPLPRVIADYNRLLKETEYLAEIPVLSQSQVEIEKVPHQIFSDTIFIWSKGSRREDIYDFLHACCLLIAASVRVKLPLRGGVAYGECLMDSNRGRFIGRAIVDAYESEKIQEWVGIGLHESCFSSPIGNDLLKFDNVLEYPVPVKPCKPAIRHTLRWHGYADLNAEEVLEGLLADALLADASGERNAEKKIRNVLSFCRSVTRVID
jgi:hypothetical protein